LAEFPQGISCGTNEIALLIIHQNNIFKAKQQIAQGTQQGIAL